MYFIKKRQIACIVLGLLLKTALLMAQSASVAEELKLLQTIQKQLSGNLIIEGEYALYNDFNSTEPSERVNLQMSKEGLNIYSKMGYIESLSNGSYNISVNNQDKYLVVSQRSKQKMEKKPAIMPLMLMAKIEKYAKYSIATHLEKNEHGLCVEPKFGEIEKMEYYYNTTTNLPTRCVLFYRNVLRNGLPEAIKQPKVILRFTKIDTKPNFGKGVFSELKYFKIAPNKKRIILQAAYSSYKMMGQ